MKLIYSVHSAVEDKATITAQVNGKDREVQIDALVVELVGNGSALTFRFDELDEAKKLFVVGKNVTLTFGGAK